MSMFPIPLPLPPAPMPIPVPAVPGLASTVVETVNSVIDGIQSAVTGAAGAAEAVLEGRDGSTVNVRLGGDVVSRREFNAALDAIKRGLRANGSADAQVATRLEALERQAQQGYAPVGYQQAQPMSFGMGGNNPMGALAMASLMGGGGLTFTTAQKRALFLMTGDKTWLFLS